jgi:hypothetical protein
MNKITLEYHQNINGKIEKKELEFSKHFENVRIIAKAILTCTSL